MPSVILKIWPLSAIYLQEADLTWLEGEKPLSLFNPFPVSGFVASGYSCFAFTGPNNGTNLGCGNGNLKGLCQYFSGNKILYILRSYDTACFDELMMGWASPENHSFLYIEKKPLFLYFLSIFIIKSKDMDNREYKAAIVIE